MVSQDSLKRLITEEYQYLWYLYEWIWYPLSVVFAVAILFIVMNTFKNRIKQIEPVQLLEIMIVSSYFSLAVCTAALSILVTISNFRLEINTYVKICLIFTFKCSLSSFILHLFLILFGEIHPRGYGVYVNRKRVYICIIVAWIMSIIPALFTPFSIIFIVLLGISFLCLLNGVFGKSNGFIISRNCITI